MCPLSRGPPACPGSEGRPALDTLAATQLDPRAEWDVDRTADRCPVRVPGRGDAGRGHARRPSSSCGAWATRSSSSPAPAPGRASPTPPTRRPARGSADRDEVWASDLVLKINAPSDEEIARLRDGAILASLVSPAIDPDLVAKLAARRITVLAMDAVPRISRAQSLDVLSSMANIAGYRAVIEAAHEFGSLFTGQVTAAGKVPPAKVLVVGAGVAGLAAIGTAGSLGAMVRAFDARPEVGEQVESMGAEFLRVERSRGGVAGQRRRLRPADVRGLRPQGRRAVCRAGRRRRHHHHHRADPRPARAAAHHGGDGRHDEAGQRHRRHGRRQRRQLRAVGRRPDGRQRQRRADHRLHRPGRPAADPGVASCSRTNLVNLLKLLTPGKDGQPVLDMDDQVVRGMTVVRDGELLWPPPPVQVSATARRDRPWRSGRRRRRRLPTRAGATSLLVVAALLLGLARRVLPVRAPRPLDRVRARRGRRVLRHHQRPPRAAHAADVGDQRHQRHHRHRRAAAGRHAERRSSPSSPSPASSWPASTSSAGSP